jgi:hypothetical protein
MLKLKNIKIANERSELLIPNFAKHANSIVEPSLMQINQMVLNTPASSPYFKTSSSPKTTVSKNKDLRMILGEQSSPDEVDSTPQSHKRYKVNEDFS